MFLNSWNFRTCSLIENAAFCLSEEAVILEIKKGEDGF